MPRRKTPLDERKRSSAACVVCKASKIRCDAQTPCTACVRRGRESSCIYSGVDGRRRPSRQSTTSMDRPLTSALRSATETSPVSIVLGPNLSTNASTPAPKNQQTHLQSDRSHRGISYTRMITLVDSRSRRRGERLVLSAVSSRNVATLRRIDRIHRKQTS